MTIDIVDIDDIDEVDEWSIPGIDVGIDIDIEDATVKCFDFTRSLVTTV